MKKRSVKECFIDSLVVALGNARNVPAELEALIGITAVHGLLNDRHTYRQVGK